MIAIVISMITSNNMDFDNSCLHIPEMEPTDEESLAPDAKKRKITFKKWKTEMDKECQTHGSTVIPNW